MVSQEIRRKRVMKFCVIPFLENAFERLGRIIARWPYLVIVFWLLFTGLCSIGVFNLKFESDMYKIWNTNPSGKLDGSQSVVNKEWVSNNFVDDERRHTIIFSSIENDGDILTPNGLQVMLDVHRIISRPLENVSFNDICYR